MKAALLYFTGTGNTYRTVKYVQECISFDMDIFDVIKDDVVNLSTYDYLIICYPIYGFNCPKPVIDYVKKMKRVEHNVPCLVMKNSGEHLFWNNGSSLYLRRLLRKRNVSLKSEYHYLMPYSFVFRHSDFMAYRMDRSTYELIPLDVNDFLKEKYHPIRRFFGNRLFSYIFRIQWWGGRINGKHYKIDTTKCLKCMKCVKGCPVNNIEYKDDKFIFGKKCLMCQRCVLNCPVDAFISLGAFTSWKVNGPYSFKEQKEYQPEIKPKFCKKNYERYFLESEKRIAQKNDSN